VHGGFGQITDHPACDNRVVSPTRWIEAAVGCSIGARISFGSQHVNFIDVLAPRPLFRHRHRFECIRDGRVEAHQAAFVARLDEQWIDRGGRNWHQAAQQRSSKVRPPPPTRWTTRRVPAFAGSQQAVRSFVQSVRGLDRRQILEGIRRQSAARRGLPVMRQ
jgi:hypothetical protein